MAFLTDEKLVIVGAGGSTECADAGSDSQHLFV